MMNTYIGDKSQSYNKGMEPPDTNTYHCFDCGHEQEVAVAYDLLSRMFFPVRFNDTLCNNCGSEMDKAAG